MMFNVNNYVYVQLTDLGKQILYEQFLGRQKRLPKVFTEFHAPQEDEDGWSKWQLWSLMETFGKHIGIGRELPFEAEIRIGDNK